MAIIIDFETYKEDKEIQALIDDSLMELEFEELNKYCFACPDCESTGFKLFLNLTARCCVCDLEIELRPEEE